MGIYFIFAAILVIALFGFIIAYREDHPKKAK
jgi:hypothetical protein